MKEPSGSATTQPLIMAEDSLFPKSLHDWVLVASAHSYESVGQPVKCFVDAGSTQPAAFDLLLPEMRRIEEIETEDSLEHFRASTVEPYREDGFDVWVLVPLHTMGKAHTHLRGVADFVQPWWIEGGALKFGTPERA